jgi:hypothetical protein
MKWWRRAAEEARKYLPQVLEEREQEESSASKLKRGFE